MLRASVTLAFATALGLACAACSDFAESEAPVDGGAADAPAPETSVPEGGTTDGGATSVAVDEPTEIVLGPDPSFLFIATGQAAVPLYRWPLAETTATRFGDAVSGVKNFVARTDSLMFIGDDRMLYDMITSGADAGARRTCVSEVVSFAFYNSSVVYSIAPATYFTSYPGCNVGPLLSGVRGRLMTSTVDALLQYQDIVGGRIVKTTNLVANGGGAEVITGIGTNVTAMTADVDSVYWATSDAIRKAPRAGGGTATTLADGQKQPRTLAVQGGDIYWTNYDEGTVMRQPTSGSSPPVPILSGLKSPWGLVVTAKEIFVAVYGENRVLRSKRP